ncbi:MAG: hypothetical protein SOV27_01205 [Eubacteriales bacterium]|nr:hypothetical protein [Eubacteriales bacterium]
MESISAWILSIAGICMLSVIIDLVIPDGKTNTIIKNVFSYSIVLVVILPLPKLFKNNTDLNDLFSPVDFPMQDNYIYNVNQAKLDKWTQEINDDLVNGGIYGAVVSISANIFERNMEINAVYVDLYNVVISNENKNINIKTEVVRVVLNYINIKEDKVIFYE